MSNMISEQKLYDTLQQQFELSEFRPGQLHAIQCLLQHERVLCIQPTGHGKSLLYQLPSVILPGITLVISPLLALMRDQISQLNQRFQLPATSINTDQSDEENRQAYQQAAAGDLKILFIAPEQLDNLHRIDFLLSLPISLLVIDEAHCISTWGHDFRPSYRQIIQFVTQKIQSDTSLKLLALTATANQTTEDDIKKQLQVDDKPVKTLRHSMDRPNIQLSVYPQESLAKKLITTWQLIHQLNGTGLIYCATRENTTLVADYLTAQGVNAAAYHAGMSMELKRQLQQEFINDKYKVIAATNALGMGIDKANLRFIIHFDIPSSITAYYQEIGRCGRDGKPAQAILLFDPQDKKIQQYFIDSAQPQVADFDAIRQLVNHNPQPPGLVEIKRLTGLHPTRVTIVVAELLEQGFLTKIKSSTKQVYVAGNTTRNADLSRYDNQYTSKTQELTRMLDYAKQTEQCLMLLLRTALSDQEAIPCGHCGVCQPSKLKIADNKLPIDDVANWLAKRVVAISYQSYQLQPGVALLDGSRHSNDFLHFMKHRQNPDAENQGLTDTLAQLFKQQLRQLRQQYQIDSVIVIPSNTWQHRAQIAQRIASYLNVPCYLDYLQWREPPEKRQGECLNNDQRRHNVAKKMTVVQDSPRPNGNLLLVDDYTGSGATLKEAARVLVRLSHVQGQIIPLTIASVKWRLGSPGIV